MEYKITRGEIKKLSREFRVSASELFRGSPHGMSSLRRFIKFIEDDPIIYDFLSKNQVKQYDISLVIQSSQYGNIGYELPDSREEEISFTYQLLKYGLENFRDYYRFPMSVGGYPGSKITTQVEGFNKAIVLSFTNRIEGYLNAMLIDLGDEDQKVMDIKIEKFYAATATENHSTQNNDLRNANVGSVAGRDHIGDITYNYAEQKNLAEAAAEIQQLLKQLEQTYPTATFVEKAAVAAKAIETIESDPTLKGRVVGALRSAGMEAFKEAVDHPLVNILAAGIDGWREG